MSQRSDLLAELRHVLTNALSLEELRVLAFDLGIPFDELDGTARTQKVIALLEHVARHRKFNNLIDNGKRVFPHIPWDMFAPLAANDRPSFHPPLAAAATQPPVASLVQQKHGRLYRISALIALPALAALLFLFFFGQRWLEPAVNIVTPVNNESVAASLADQGSTLISVTGVARVLKDDPTLKVYIVYRSVTPPENIWWIAFTDIDAERYAWTSTVWSGDAGHQRQQGDAIELYAVVTKKDIPFEENMITSLADIAPIYTSEKVTAIIGSITPP